MSDSLGKRGPERNRHYRDFMFPWRHGAYTIHPGMTKGDFELGAQVWWRAADGTRHRGRVTDVLARKRRVVADTGTRPLLPVTSLHHARDHVLILEGRLDRPLRSKRMFGPMMQNWLSAYRVTAHYERIHTGEDLRGFLQREGRDPNYRVIHIMCHGRNLQGRTGSVLELTHETIDLQEHLAAFSGLNGKILILSACQLGTNRALMKELKRVSGASAVVAYRKDVFDWYTNLAEVLLYDQLLAVENASTSPRTAVQRTHKALRCVGTCPTDEPWRGPVIVCV